MKRFEVCCLSRHEGFPLERNVLEMNIRFLHKSTLIKKLMFPYILVISLPILIIWIYLFPQLEQRMLDNILMHQKSNIARLSITLDQNISTMLSNAIAIAANPDLTPYAITRNSLGSYRAVKEINKSLLANRFVSQSFYYVKAYDRFYTSNASYPLPWLSNTNYGYCYYDWPADEMHQDLQELTALEVRPLEKVAYPEHQESHVISVLLPVPINSITPYAVLIMWIDQKELTSLIAPIQSEMSECTLIYDSTGKRIFSLNDEKIGLSPEVLDRAVLEKGQNGAGQIMLAGKRYVYASVVQENNTWQCISLMQFDALISDIQAMCINLLLITFLLLLACAVIIGMAVRSHYQPIHTLELKARQYAGTEEAHNEFEVVHHALDHLNTKAAQLQSRYLDTIPLLRAHHLYTLIGGQYETMEAFNESSTDSQIHFTFPYLCVTVIRTDAMEPCDALEYLENLEGGLPRGLEGYYLPAFDRKDILFISASQSPQMASVYIRDICEDMSATLPLKIRAAVGYNVTKPVNLPYSYSEAVNRIEKMTLTGAYGVECCTGETPTQNASVVVQLYPMDYAVNKLDTGQIRKSVEDVLSFFKNENPSPAMIRAVYLNALTSLLRGLNTLGMDTKGYHSLLNISRRLNYEEMSSNLYQLSGMLCDCIEKDSPETSIKIEDVQAYIFSTCLNYSFSVQGVAEHFDMSYTNFSHYFKRKTGVTCKQFVDEYRAEKAIELIMNTLEPLDAIAQKVGFSNAASFIRSFKKVTGKTPGSYRNL